MGALLIAIVASIASGAAAAVPFIPSMQPGDAIPPIPLVAQDRRPFTLADFAGKAIAISFIYTRCRDARMCPLVAAKFAQAQHTIGAAPVRLVLVSLDPAYDRPAVLARYGRALGEDPRYFTLATGSPAAIAELAARLGIATSTTAPGAIVHTEVAAIIGPDGRLARIIDGNDWSPADLIAAARASLPASHEPFVGLRSWLAAAMERCGAGGAPALGGTAMLVILGLALAAAGGVFWFAFRDTTANHAAPTSEPLAPPARR